MDREKEAAVLRHALSVNLHTLRRERKLSQEKLEGLTGVSANAIGKIERGITNVQLDTLAALASGLGVSVRQFAGSSCGFGGCFSFYRNRRPRIDFVRAVLTSDR